MLRGTVPQFLKAQGFDAEGVVDTRRSLTVTKPDVLAYLKSHSGEAQEYFVKNSGFRQLHEALLLERDGVGYMVSVNDHGVRRFTEKLATLDEAVAAHVLAAYGKT